MLGSELRSWGYQKSAKVELPPGFQEHLRKSANVFGGLKTMAAAPTGAIVAGRRLPRIGSGPWKCWKMGEKLMLKMLNVVSSGKENKEKISIVYSSVFYFLRCLYFWCSGFLLTDGNWCTGLPHHRWRKWVAGWVDFWHKVNQVGSLSCLVVLGMA